MKRITLIILLAGCLLGSRAFGQADYYLPQVADGQAGNLMIKTTFVFFNPSGDSVGAELSLTDDLGHPFEVTLDERGTHSSFTVSLNPGETLFLSTDGQAPLKTGGALVTSDSSLGVSAVFTTSTLSGSFITEAGVGASVPYQSFRLPVDTTQDFDTGLACYNVSQAEASLTFRVIDAAGHSGQSASRSLPARGHRALFLTELFPQLAGFRGTLLVEASRAVASIVLRQNFSTLTSTTLPVVQSGSQQVEFYLPQIANGVYPAGSVRTGFIIFNLSASAPAEVDVTLTKDNGSPFPVSIPGLVQNGASFRVALPPGGSAFLETNGAGTLAAGAAFLKSDVPVGVSSIFTLYDSGGRFATEAGVGDSPGLSSFTIPVDTRGSFDTGVALFNPGVVGSTVTVRLLDGEGTRVKQTEFPLPPSGHRALLVKDVFGGASLAGSLSITATMPLSAVTLRLNAVPLSYTTLPRVSDSFIGTVPRLVLLDKQLGGVNVEAPATLTVSLDTGFRLSGSIKGEAGPILSVAAVGGAGGTGRFVGRIDSTRGRYSIAVPAGSYSLRVCYKPAIAPQSSPVLVFSPPDVLQVGKDTSFDIVVPKVSLVTVSGGIEGLSGGTASVIVRFTGTDGKAGADAFLSLEHRYAVSLPAGSYAVTLIVTVFGDFGSNQLALANVGSVTVGESDLQADFALPALAILFGTVQVTGLSTIPSGSFISAVDIAAPVTEGSWLPNVSKSSLPAGSSGDYRATLATGHTYDLQANVKLSQSSLVMFPVQPRRVALTGAVQQTFAVGAWPGTVSLTGVVQSSTGEPVPDVRVRASSEQLTGLTDAASLVTGQTNLRGEFRLDVPSGKAYNLTFTPPAP